MTFTNGKSFTAKKAIYLNMQLDNLKIRSNRIESKTKYSRKDKSWNKD